MTKLLIVYGTTEGQTAKIAHHVADAARRLGHDVTIRHAPEVRDGEVEAHDCVIVGASLHEGRYQRAVRDFIERHGDALAARRGAFFSVSLAAASRDPRERAEPLRLAEEFTRGAGWAPARIASFAGALKYTRYGWLKRMLMKHIARQEGGDTDTSRDFEYTDWGDVDRFAEAFLSEPAQ
ncbi:MAG TPA: menaquinone-dependent protoporphyrinogen IX dehydrogenase [Gammaproteobacteria bacterium]